MDSFMARIFALLAMFIWVMEFVIDPRLSLLLHVPPIFVVGIASVPLCDAVCEEPRLLNFVQRLVQQVGLRVRHLRYSSLDV